VPLTGARQVPAPPPVRSPRDLSCVPRKIHRRPRRAAGILAPVACRGGAPLLRPIVVVMSWIGLIKSCTEGLVRVVIGAGLAWIGVVEGAGYGAFLQVVGAIFVVAGIVEVSLFESAVRRLPRPHGAWRNQDIDRQTPGGGTSKTSSCASRERFSTPRP
jgi:hypothetical protein